LLRREIIPTRGVCAFAPRLSRVNEEGPSASLWRHPDYVRLWFARLAGISASQMMMVAIGWQMYELTGSAWDLGLVGLVQFAPSLLLTLPAGHLIDRHHRARIVALCMAVQVCSALLLGAGSAGGFASRGLLLAVSALLGCVRAFQYPAQQALTPLLVPPALLPRALALASAGMQGAIIGAPALGGLLYAFGAPCTYGACALLFTGACVLCLLLRYRHAAPSAEPATLHALLAGVRYVWHHKVVLGAISLDLFAVLFGGATALLPMFAKDILHVGPFGLGLLRSAPALGALSMSALLVRWPVRRRTGHVLLTAVAVYGVATLVFGVSTSFMLSMAALAITGAADMVSVVIRQTLVQLETPDHVRGRVSAVNSVFIGASNQLGEFESGATAAVMGPLGSVVFGGLCTLVVAGLWCKLFPALAQRDGLVQAGTAKPAGRAQA
jgi:MFS family permease